MPIQMPPVENGVETLEMISARFSVQRARLDALIDRSVVLYRRHLASLN